MECEVGVEMMSSEDLMRELRSALFLFFRTGYKSIYTFLTCGILDFKILNLLTRILLNFQSKEMLKFPGSGVYCWTILFY